MAEVAKKKGKAGVGTLRQQGEYWEPKGEEELVVRVWRENIPGRGVKQRAPEWSRMCFEWASTRPGIQWAGAWGRAGPQFGGRGSPSEPGACEGGHSHCPRAVWGLF